jgi:Zn finger protein HypA/HybF involved in hydrogenase expression
MNDINKLVDSIKEYYTSNNFKLPGKVSEYIENYPVGLSRQVLKTKYGLTTAQLVHLLNSEYIRPLSAQERVLIEADRLRYTVLSDVKLLTTNRCKATLQCKDCGHVHVTTITSLQGSTLGCPKCKSGNLPWSKRKEELIQIIQDRLDSELISSIPDNQTGYVALRHICGTEYTSQLVGVVSPNSTLRATCPNCRPTDRRVVLEGITFGSDFESKCYLILKPKAPEIHIPYRKYLDTNRKWVCDFKVQDYWIEVSNFKQDYKGYFANIEEKRNVVESSGYTFLFVTSLKELEELVLLM